MVSAQTGIIAREIATSLIQKLSPYKEQFLKATEEIAESASAVDANNVHATVDDNGASKATFDARNVLDKHLLGIQNILSHSIGRSSPTTLVQKQKLADIFKKIRKPGNIDPTVGLELIEILEEIQKNGVPERDQNKTKEAPHVDAQENQKEQNAQPQSAEQKLNEDSVGFLADNVKKIMRRELLNKSSWIGLANEIAKRTGMGSIDDVEKFIDKNLMTEKFKEGLKNSILGKKIDDKDFNPLQSKAFTVASWSILAIDKMPSLLIQYFPLLTTAIKFSMPIWTHIPKLNKTLGTLYPFIDEIGAFVGKFQEETDNIKKAVGRIKSEEAAKATPEPGLAGATG